MSSRPRTARPRLEALEDRVVPTTTLQFDTSGNLIGVVSNDAVLTLQMTATDVVDVIANGVSQGIFPTGLSLTVTEAASTANPGPQITFDLNGNEFDGKFTIKAGDAKFGDIINIGGPTAAGGGTIVGNVSVTTGNNDVAGSGADSVSVGQNAAVAIKGSLFIDTGADKFTPTPLFSDVVNLGPGNPVGDTTVSGSVTILNATAVFVSDVPIGGAVKIDSSKQFAPATVLISATTVGNSLTINTGPLSDFVFLSADTIIDGNVAVNLGNGAAPFGDDFEDAARIYGGLSVKAGNGPEVVNLSNLVGGNLAIAVGSGQDSITLSGLSVFGTFIKITTGSGNNNLIINNVTATGARMTVLLGAGNDTVTFDINTNILASLYIDGGFGTNKLVEPSGPYPYYPTTLLRIS